MENKRDEASSTLPFTKPLSGGFHFSTNVDVAKAFSCTPLRDQGKPQPTNDLPFDKFELHRKAADGLTAPFSDYLESLCAEPGGRKPDWIIVDYFNDWAAAAAIQHKVPCAMLALLAATVVATLDILLSERTASRSAGAPRFATEKTGLMSLQCKWGMSIAEQVSSTLQRCKLVAMRSCSEWEPESVAHAATFGGKPVVPFGLLPPSPDGGRRGDSGKDDTAVRWLDAQLAKSVVYVALGSEVPLRPEEVRELALGLQLAGTRFLWALRKPPGVDADVLLPQGFEECTRGRGLVITGWVPQLGILAHDAVAAFLTHCGLSSTIEGLLFGRPLVMLPIMGDQVPNARLMECRKVGVLVPRNEKDCSFDREGVATAIQAVAVEEEGGDGAVSRPRRRLAAGAQAAVDSRLHYHRNGGAACTSGAAKQMGATRTEEQLGDRGAGEGARGPDPSLEDRFQGLNLHGEEEDELDLSGVNQVAAGVNPPPGFVSEKRWKLRWSQTSEEDITKEEDRAIPRNH
uniref:Glycosyltransferase n=1 Tax=Aegilops tauschii TaxID=37682 RepID=M8C624_AEGTA